MVASTEEEFAGLLWTVIVRKKHEQTVFNVSFITKLRQKKDY